MDGVTILANRSYSIGIQLDGAKSWAERDPFFQKD